LAKCHFFKDRVDYLGHVVLPGKLAVAQESTKAIAEATFPETPTQMRSFLGSCNVYRRFAKDFAHIARPLNEMLTKERLPNFGEQSPTVKEKEAFEALKAILVNPPVLALPRVGKDYIVDTDASAYQVGCCLLQEQDDETWHPVGYWSRALNKAERGYSPTERECLAVVWAVTTLRPYLERTKFVVRSDHGALRWLMNATDLSGRLVRWRLRLSEFDYSIVYRPGRVHQVPDALSRVPTKGMDDSPLDDAIPCLVIAPDAEGMGDVDAGHHLPDEGDGEYLFDEPDFFDPYRARTNMDKPFTKGDSVLLTDTRQREFQHEAIELDEWLLEQQRDEFCLRVLARQSATTDSAFFEDEDGLLRRHSTLDKSEQIVVPASLRPRLLAMSHRNLAAGHPGQTRMYDTMRVSYYWPAMAADIAATVQRCSTCAQNRLRYKKRSTTLKLFPALKPLEDVGIDILGPLPRTKKGNKFLLIISCRFSKLTQVAPLKTITAYNVAVAFVTQWAFKYGPPRTLLSDNGSQFASRLFQSICLEMGTKNLFTSTYHPQTNGQVERFNRTLQNMLRNYVNEHQSDWDVYAHTLAYAYNNHVHRSTGTTPFELILSRPPAPFSLHHSVRRRPKPDAATKQDFLNRFASSIADARSTLLKSQERYKRDFDRRVRESNQRLEPGDYVYLDVPEWSHRLTKPGGKRIKGKLAPIATRSH